MSQPNEIIILIADDDEVTRWGVSRVLQKLDPEVVIAPRMRLR